MRIQRFALFAIIFSAGLWFTISPSTQAADMLIPVDPGGLTIGEALAQASRNRQELATLRLDLDAAVLKLKHAGLPPNPELEVEWDNLGGDLPADDVRETTVSLSQTLEIGGKPAARKSKGLAEINQLRSGAISRRRSGWPSWRCSAPAKG